MLAGRSDIACNSGLPVLQKNKAHQTRFGKTSKRYQHKVCVWKFHFLGVVQELQRAFPPTSTPVDFVPMTSFLSGYNIHFHPFNPLKVGVDFEGTNEIDGKDIHVYYSILVPPERQRFTAAHEFAHVLQRLDDAFLADMESIEDDDERSAIIESVADYVASFYLVPPNIAENLLAGQCNLATPEARAACVAEEMWVSKQMAKIVLGNYQVMKRQTVPQLNEKIETIINI